MLILGQKKEPQRIVLRAAVPPTRAVRKAGKIVTPATEGEPEAHVVMAPITSAMRRRANHAYKRQLGDYSDPSELDLDRMLDATEAYAFELVRLGMVGWGGIGDAGGEPVALTPDRETRFKTAKDDDRPTGTIDQLLADEEVFELIAGAYARPDMQRQAEKNGFAASPSGTGGAATRGSATASSRAARAAKRNGAKNARTASTRSRPRRARPPGKR